MNEILSQFAFKNMSRNIFLYISILMTSSLGFMHPRVAFLENGYLESGYLPKRDVTFKSHTEKNPDLAVNIFNVFRNIIEGRISEIPDVRYSYKYRNGRFTYLRIVNLSFLYFYQ